MTKTGSNDLNSVDDADMLATFPIQATGSGVADLEIAYEQMQLLAEDKAANASDPVTDIPATSSEIPTDGDQDFIESAAHPS